MEQEGKMMEAEVKSQFVQEVMNLPVVETVAGKVADVYSSTKEYSPVLKYTMETAESVVKYGADSAKPLINKFEKPLAAVDNFAYENLKKLETNYPIIAKQPGDIIQSSQNAIQDVKNYGVDKINVVKNYGYEQMDNAKNYGYDKVQMVKNYGTEKMTAAMESKIGKDVISKVEEVLTITEKYLDDFIPPAECESNKEVSTTENAENNVQRLAVLSVKAHTRLRCLALQHLEKLKIRAENKIEELKAVLICLKEKTASSAKSYNERVQKIWQELNKENETQDAQHWREKLLHKTRLLTKSLIHIFKQSSNVLTYVSTKAKQRFLEATEQTETLYNTFKQASAGEITDAVLTRSQESLQKLQDIIGSLRHLRFAPLSKMVQDVLSECSEDSLKVPTDDVFETPEDLSKELSSSASETPEDSSKVSPNNDFEKARVDQDSNQT